MINQTQPVTEMQPQYNTELPKKSKKKPIITLLLVLIVGIVVGCFLAFGSKKKSGAEKALDQYFKAVNNLDRAAIWELCNPKEEYKDVGSLYSYFTQRLGFTQGILQNADFLKMDWDITGKYYADYGFTGDRENVIEERRTVIEDNSQIKRAMPGFHVSYTLKNMKKASECTIGYKDGLKIVEVDNIEENIENRQGVDIEDGEVYVAKMSIKWEYNNMPYGNNKEWWDIDEFKNSIASSNNWQTYESTIKYYDDTDYYMIIYKCGDKWYLYLDSIIQFSNNWDIKM